MTNHDDHLENVPSQGAQEEYEADILVHLLGRRAFERMQVDDPANVLFLDWLAVEARAEQTAHERARTQSLAREFAVQTLVRFDVRSRVRLVDGEPPAESQRAALSLEWSLEEASYQRMAPQLDTAVAAGSGRELWEEAVESWVHVPDELPDGRYVALPVAGDSMVPLFHAGDVILVRLGKEIIAGDVVVARYGDEGYVVKRVGRVRQDHVELQSLNPAYEPLRVRADELSVFGTVVLRWCSHRAA
jgi:phage repressor protein C with HTH and peptisase S24 domain